MDIKKIISDIIEKFKSTPDAVRGLQSEPAKTIKDLTGLDVPEDQLNAVVDGGKAKLSGGELGEKLEGVLKIFNK